MQDKPCPKCRTLNWRTAAKCKNATCDHRFTPLKPADATTVPRKKRGAAAPPAVDEVPDPDFVPGVDSNGGLTVFYPRRGEYHCYTREQRRLIEMVLGVARLEDAGQLYAEHAGRPAAAPGVGAAPSSAEAADVKP